MKPTTFFSDVGFAAGPTCLLSDELEPEPAAPEPTRFLSDELEAAPAAVAAARDGLATPFCCCCCFFLLLFFFLSSWLFSPEVRFVGFQSFAMFASRTSASSTSALLDPELPADDDLADDLLLVGSELALPSLVSSRNDAKGVKNEF